MKKLHILICAVAISFAGTAQVDKGNLLIRNGTVLTVTKGTMESTDVLIRDGKIAQIAKGIAAPPGGTCVKNAFPAGSLVQTIKTAEKPPEVYAVSCAKPVGLEKNLSPICRRRARLSRTDS